MTICASRFFDCFPHTSKYSNSNYILVFMLKINFVTDHITNSHSNFSKLSRWREESVETSKRFSINILSNSIIDNEGGLKGKEIP